MNVQLQKLFSQYDLWEKNMYEIDQFFWILSSVKQQKLLQEFGVLVEKIQKIETDISIEQEILLDSILPDIHKLLHKK
jgi:hypothetical protein